MTKWQNNNVVKPIKLFFPQHQENVSEKALGLKRNYNALTFMLNYSLKIKGDYKTFPNTYLVYQIVFNLKNKKQKKRSILLLGAE